MLSPNTITISETVLPTGAHLYDHNHAVGNLEAIYTPKVQVYNIATLDVEQAYRRMGIGAELLRSARAHASEIGALAIRSTIVTMESYCTFRKVFGEEHITVYELGDFSNDGHPVYNTSAQLHLNLE